MQIQGRNHRSFVVSVLLGVSAIAMARPVEAQTTAGLSPRTPNVVLIMADDVGFSMASAFGGPVPTPNMEKLAAQGLRYNQFNTAAQCSPTRAALLTGRNPHRVNMGAIVNTAGPQPGYSGEIPKSAASIGKILSLNGYATAWFGKGHITPLKTLANGPFDRWPTGLGFDYFFGMLAGSTDQFRPALFENTTRIPQPPEPAAGYILERDLTDRAINWYRDLRARTPSKPFFIYYASGAVHAPQQAPQEWIARFHGRFDQGWDSVRAETFARQKKAGIVPASAVLTPRPAALPAWDSLSADQKRLAARMMEVAAAQEAFFDDQLGRLFSALEEDGISDETLIMLINGDNGASQEGTPTGAVASRAPSLENLDEFGSAEFPVHYNAGWAWAMNAPFQYYKHLASHLGGIRNGLTVRWPGHVARPGSIRSQYAFVTDVAPTIYEATGIVPPSSVDGVEQLSFDGISLMYTFRSASAASRRREQYIENNGNRSFYKDGWLASTAPPKQIWDPGTFAPVADWSWELYDLRNDFSQSRNLAARYPRKLQELRDGYAAAERANGFVVRQTPEGRPKG
ncbi:MAG: arylsulfatase [Gammaproteobacteria bacterium]|nr:arylsulfatase [Gammaproteobacteria bacterium]